MYRAGVIGLGLIGVRMDEFPPHPMVLTPYSHCGAYELHRRCELVAGSSRSDENRAHFQSSILSKSRGEALDRRRKKHYSSPGET
jgi:hypothetical protein